MMKYADVRSLIQDGDLLAWSSGGWTNWHDIQVNIVRMATRSEFSHVGVACVLNGRVFILEAVGQGVRLFPLSREIPFYWCPRPTVISPKALEWAFMRLGDEYSKWQAIKAQLGWLKNGKDRRWECAEYAIGIYATDREFIDIRATPTEVVKYAMTNWSPLFYIKE